MNFQPDGREYVHVVSIRPSSFVNTSEVVGVPRSFATLFVSICVFSRASRRADTAGREKSHNWYPTSDTASDTPAQTISPTILSHRFIDLIQPNSVIS